MRANQLAKANSEDISVDGGKSALDREMYQTGHSIRRAPSHSPDARTDTSRLEAGKANCAVSGWKCKTEAAHERRSILEAANPTCLLHRRDDKQDWKSVVRSSP
jgi:hypothetical protein